MKHRFTYKNVLDSPQLWRAKYWGCAELYEIVMFDVRFLQVVQVASQSLTDYQSSYEA
jgi:hypothetical protein